MKKRQGWTKAAISLTTAQQILQPEKTNDGRRYYDPENVFRLFCYNKYYKTLSVCTNISFSILLFFVSLCLVLLQNQTLRTADPVVTYAVEVQTSLSYIRLMQ